MLQKTLKFGGLIVAALLLASIITISTSMVCFLLYDYGVLPAHYIQLTGDQGIYRTSSETFCSDKYVSNRNFCLSKQGTTYVPNIERCERHSWLDLRWDVWNDGFRWFTLQDNMTSGKLNLVCIKVECCKE